MTQRQQDTLTLGRFRTERVLEPGVLEPGSAEDFRPGFGGWVGRVLLPFFLHR